MLRCGVLELLRHSHSVVGVGLTTRAGPSQCVVICRPNGC
jgi:hypothetical protein